MQFVRWVVQFERWEVQFVEVKVVQSVQVDDTAWEGQTMQSLYLMSRGTCTETWDCTVCGDRGGRR